MTSELNLLLDTATPREERILRLLEDYEERIQKLEMWQNSRNDALERAAEVMNRGVEYVREETER